MRPGSNVDARAAGLLRQLPPRQPSRELGVAGHPANQLATAIKRPTALACGTYPSHKDPRPKDLQALCKGKCGGYFWQGGGHRLPGMYYCVLCVWSAVLPSTTERCSVTVNKIAAPKEVAACTLRGVQPMSLLLSCTVKCSRLLVDLCSLISSKARDTSTPGLICRNAW